MSGMIFGIIGAVGGIAGMIFGLVSVFRNKKHDDKTDITHLPILDVGKFSVLSNLLNSGTYLISVGLKNIKETHTFSGAFTNNNSLTDLTTEGVIGASINFSYSHLSVASMKSVISCLKNYSGTSNEYTNTITFTEECWAALEADSIAPTGTTWTEYVDSLGWNI